MRDCAWSGRQMGVRDAEPSPRGRGERGVYIGEA